MYNGKELNKNTTVRMKSGGSTRTVLFYNFFFLKNNIYIYIYVDLLVKTRLYNKTIVKLSFKTDLRLLDRTRVGRGIGNPPGGVTR